MPEPFTGLLGRGGDVDRVLDALRDQGRVEVWGACGVGKTSLLRHLAHRAVAEFDRPVVYLPVRDLPTDDLLQALYQALCQPSAPARPSNAGVRQHLGRTTALILLDEITLTTTDLADLLRSVPNCLLAFTGPTRRLDSSHGHSVELRGLDGGAADELIHQGIAPRPANSQEDAAARELCVILAGHPLRLRQVAALVATSRHTFHSLAALLRTHSPAETLAQECTSTLDTDQRRVVAILATVAGSLLPVDLVEHMTTVGSAAERLRGLASRFMIDHDDGRYGLPVCALGNPRRLVVPTLDRAVALRGLVGWLQSPAVSPDQILSVSGSVLTLLELACDASEWESTIALVRAVEPALIVGGRWEQWRTALETAVRAARTAHDTAAHAYFVHQLGSRAITQYDPDAQRLLEEAQELRTRLRDYAGLETTNHNLALLRKEVRPWSRRPQIVTAAAVLIVAAFAGIASATRPHPHPDPTPPTASQSAPARPGSTATPPTSTSTGPPALGTTSTVTPSRIPQTATSSSPAREQVTIPLFKNIPVAEAISQLNQLDLTPRVLPTDADTAGPVWAQIPDAGTKVDPGTKVTLTAETKVTVSASQDSETPGDIVVVTSDPPGLSCTPSTDPCFAYFPPSKTIVLNAQPRPTDTKGMYLTFGSWAGDCDPKQTICTIIPSAGRALVSVTYTYKLPN